MKLQTIKIFTTAIVIFFVSIPSSYAQKEILTQKLKDKSIFKDIIYEVDSYYLSRIGNNWDSKQPSANDTIKKLIREYKHWKRWEWYQSARLQSNGEIANASKEILEVLKNLDQSNRAAGVTESSLTNSGDWTNIGPTNTISGPEGLYRGLGRIDRIAFHPTNSQIYYVGTPAGGLWGTYNDGASWTSLSDELASMGVSGIVVSNTNANTLYILTGDGDSNIGGGGFVEQYGYIRWSQGVYKSTDGGITWSRTGSFPNPPAFYSGFKLVQCPINSNLLYAATSFGIFKTLDGGQNWDVAGATGAIYHDVEFKPNSDIAYTVAKFENGSYFYKTQGAASNFNFLGSATANLPGNNFNNNDVVRYGIAVTNANPEHVVLLAGASIGNTGFQGIYRSVNSGATFLARANTPNILGAAIDGGAAGDQADYDLCVAIAHNNFQKIVTGGLCVWRSDDGGTTTSAISKYRENIVTTVEYIHPDVHDVSYNPLNNSLYACTDGGIYKSTNNGDNWIDISRGLITSQYYHLAGNEADVNKLLGGLQDNGSIYKTTASTTFKQIIGADGFRSSISSANPNIIYNTANTTVNRSTNGGTNNSDILPVATNIFFPSLRLNPSNQAKVYIGTGHNLSGFQKYVFYHSDNGGSTYIDSTTIDVTKDLACAPSDVNVLYGTNGTNIWRSQNEGYSFQLRVTGLPTSRTITSLTVNPNNAAIVVATLGGFDAGQKVYFTSDAGINWQNLSGTLPNVPIISSAINTNGDIYIGTDIGVFYQADAETDWRPFYNGLPKVPVTELIIYPNVDLIRASTFGRGIWQTSLFTSCSPTGVYSNSVGNPSVYNTSNTIQSSQNILGSAGVNVLYKAGNSITLTVGFRATQNSVMNAIIGPCTPGIYSGIMLRNGKVSGKEKVPPLSKEVTKKDGKKIAYF